MGALIALACAWFAWRIVSFSRGLVRRDPSAPGRPRSARRGMQPEATAEGPSSSTPTANAGNSAGEEAPSARPNETQRPA
jgi:hypothetical protein